jgi:hypothetical protein
MAVSATRRIGMQKRETPCGRAGSAVSMNPRRMVRANAFPELARMFLFVDALAKSRRST